MVIEQVKLYKITQNDAIANPLYRAVHQHVILARAYIRRSRRRLQCFQLKCMQNLQTRPLQIIFAELQILVPEIVSFWNRR